MSDRESRSRTRQSIVLVVASVVLLSAVVGVTALTGAASSSTSASPHDNGVGANYTVSIPNTESRQPGATGADIRHYAASGGVFEETSSPDGFKRFDTLTIRSQDIVFSSCSTENTRAFGIDRGNNDSGTTTDEGLLQHRKDSSFNEHSIYVNFYGEGAIAGSPVSLYDEDEIVAAQNGCYQMPDEPGWYQISGRVNGTGFNGNYIDSKEQGTLRSHYFYICDCSSEQEAREKLGPPPSEDDGSGDSGGGDSGGSTATATPTATSSDSGGSTATATSSDSGGSTATATSDSDGGSGDTATATSGGGTATSNAGSGTPTATGDGSTATASSATGTTAGGGSTATSGGGGAGGGGAGGGGAGGGGDSGQAGTSGTPTSGSGPGFGLIAAFGAVLGAALLAVRRRE